MSCLTKTVPSLSTKFHFILTDYSNLRAAVLFQPQEKLIPSSCYQEALRDLLHTD